MLKSCAVINRFITREIKIGEIGIGGDNPIRIQSMTNTNTMDVNATVEQILRLTDAGCEIVRLAVPGIREAHKLEEIKNELIKLRCNVPLIADVHFNPEAAIIAASLIEKVRINPGNYTDRNTGKVNFSDVEILASKQRIKDRMTPLIEVCRKYGTALRIGSNHGSLSERIVSQYGNTPEGMVESALEFVRVCRELNFHNLVLSMKASNVRLMVYSNRLLVKQMLNENMDYPIHLGVTEAGNSADGRLKSAIGIGALLADGIGDTIRVSLTEDPVNEIPVAQEIIKYFDNEYSVEKIPEVDHFFNLPHSYQPRYSDRSVLNTGEKSPLVLGSKTNPEEQKPDIVMPDGLAGKNVLFIHGNNAVKNDGQPNNQIIVFEAVREHALFEIKEFIRQNLKAGSEAPVILRKKYSGKNFLIKAALDFGPVFLEGYGDGLWIEYEKETDGENSVTLSFQLLQASGARITKTEYIACPSCGRTLYDIQASLEKIRKKTGHLKGLKIAVMGCIVNGPGEMADADYGYIGMGAGKVALFKGKLLMKKGVPEEEAVDQLIGIIKENGDWCDPPQQVTSV
ncbi:MAG: 4-hydroxy-3-methylbut-2-en-1-yl diphosphate synthase [Sphingobacteriia bacterium]|nr:4-hydroxy-3-methylbut-2-en-1-yl diphosphate synthase [Sphingobacteriia bacterium]